jgi:hypothetical protein
MSSDHKEMVEENEKCVYIITRSEKLCGQTIKQEILEPLYLNFDNAVEHVRRIVNIDFLRAEGYGLKENWTLNTYFCIEIYPGYTINKFGSKYEVKRYKLK